MTDFKLTIWMADWSPDDHKAYAAAWEAARTSDPDEDTGRCSIKWLDLILGAAKKSQWARDVLADMQRRGALESYKEATTKPPRVKAASGRQVQVKAAAKRRATDGKRDVYVQTELFDMRRPELLQKISENRQMAEVYGAKAYVAQRLVELVDAAIKKCGASVNVTPRQAAALLKVDLQAWCAA